MPDEVGYEKPKIAEVSIENINENKVKQYDARKRLLEESILGMIPEGHPVVFISYSWDSPEHKVWVAKFADDLTSKGIYVLFDDYLDSGTTLPMFMEYGIERSDKVLIIGTPKYKV
ncbi:TIR domain-containing protein [Leyella stercorea]|uniref:TIR domain-containing protein n=1 Tax=Leyella stercorea TaxID=363265 RepID=A0A3R6FKV7_9BACT|nr:TIR domain-containing protein [Leyella stercorea]